MLLVFAIMEIASAQWYGWRGLELSYAWWSVEAAFVIITALPLLLTVRAVRVTRSHLIVRFYFGGIRRYAWDSFKHVSLFEIAATNDGEKRMLRMVPRRGRTVSLTDRMSNWERLMAEIIDRVGSGVSLNPSFIERVLWRAKPVATT